MSVTTARDIIRFSLNEIGVTAAGETPSAQDTQDSFDKLNLMIDEWAGDNLMHSEFTQESFALSANTFSYAIGSGQTFDTTKPFYVKSAYIRDSGGGDYPLAVKNKNDYNPIFDKDLQSRPVELIYDPVGTQQANQYGTIYLYPNPDAAYTLYLTSQQPFTEFSSINSAVTFPVGYKKALIENLALDLCAMFGKEVPSDLAVRAKNSKDNIRRINSRNRDKDVYLSVPGDVGHGFIDIREGIS
jgi:hypothetical protein